MVAPNKSAAKQAVEGPEVPFLAWADYESPSGETWHVTIRSGATKEHLSGMVALLQAFSEEAIQAGFVPISDINEYGKAIPITMLRQWRENATTKAAETAAKKQAANEQAPASAKAQKASQPSAPAPAQQRQERKGWDTRQSPIAVSHLVIQGTKEAPSVVMQSPNPALKHPVFTSPAKLVGAIISGHYDLEQRTREAIYALLNEVGGTVDVQWYIHWAPSPKNPSWKDIQDIEIPKLAQWRKEGVPVGQAAPREQDEDQSQETGGEESWYGSQGEPSESDVTDESDIPF
jgi:hypothetical protein